MDTQTAKSLGIVAETCAQWLKDNPDYLEVVKEDGSVDEETYGMGVLCTAFMRAFYELIQLGAIKPGRLQ